MSTESQEVLAALDALGRRIAAKDPAFVELFAPDDDVRLIGSEHGELAEGRAAIGALLAGFFASPVRLGWEWSRRDATVAGDIAWLFADGVVVVGDADGEARRPYCLTGVLQRIGGEWRWRLFHGSEPA